MRILMLCPQFHPLTGGYERAAERLSATLASTGHDVMVATERREASWAARETRDGYSIRRLWCVYKPGWHGLTSLAAFAGWLLLEGRSFAVWHVHQYGAHATLAILLGKLLRRPVVVKITSSGEQGLGRALAGLRMPRFHRWAHRQMSACVAVSDETAAEALAFGIPAERIHRIGNGVDVVRWAPVLPGLRAQMRARLGLGEGFLAVAVGRVAEEKNPLGLLEAWRMASAALPGDARLAWVGDGPLREAMERRIHDLGLGERVLVVGRSDTVSDWLAAADVFVLSSRNEGMANSLLEAMACGLPAVATAVSGARQLLQATDAGLVVDVGDMQAFAEVIVRLAGDAPLRRRMGARARQVVEAGYALEVVADEVFALYGKVVNAG